MVVGAGVGCSRWSGGGIGVGVRIPNTMEVKVGSEIFVEAKLLEYRSVVKRFEFEHL